MTTLNTIIMLLAMFLALASASAASSDEEEFFLFGDPEGRSSSDAETQNTKPAEMKKPPGRRSRFLGQRPRLTCDNYPKACESKGSSDRKEERKCCNKTCVNVKVDKQNCGACGKRCKFSEICCNGRCINPSANKNHCGGCGNTCQDGGVCAFGMCSYSYS